MKREFPITVYVKGTAAKVIRAGTPHPKYPGEWVYLGTYDTPEELGAAMLAWAMGGAR